MKKTTGELRTERHRAPAITDAITFACLWPKNTENLGTLARTADALGGRLALPLDRRSHAMRAVRRGNTIGTRNTEVEWVTDRKEWLTHYSGMVVAVELAHGAIPLADMWYAYGAAVVLGHETGGVPDWALDLADAVVEIPMVGVGNSLNVAVAGSLVGYKLLGRI